MQNFHMAQMVAKLSDVQKKNYLRSLLIIGADDKNKQGNTNQKANDE